MQDRPNPRVRFREFGDSALNFELLCWVSNPALTARATHELNSAIYERFRADNIDITFTQRPSPSRLVDDFWNRTRQSKSKR